MGYDDANEGGARECPGHQWVLVDFQVVEREGVRLPGMAMVHECKWCDAVYYEPSNLDRFPDTKGVDPRV